MTDHTSPDDVVDHGVDDTMPPELVAALADPSIWADVPAGVEDAIVAAITAEAESMGLAESTVRDDESATSSAGADHSGSPLGAQPPAPEAVAPVVDLDERRRRRIRVGLVSAAAAVAIVAAGVLLTSLDDSTREPDVELALEATDLAPGASAIAEIDETPLGTRIILDLRGLPPAPEGTYYEAWLRVDAEVGVSAGTFHVRGGDGSIELWAGVTIDDYPLVTVTLQDEGGGAASSGRVVLRGLVES